MLCNDDTRYLHFYFIQAQEVQKVNWFSEPNVVSCIFDYELNLMQARKMWFKGFQLIHVIRKLYLLKEDILRCNTPLTKETTLTGINYMHYQSFTKWSCLRQFLSNFVHQCRLKDVNFNNWYNLDFFKKTNFTNHLINFSYSKHFKMVPGIQRSNGLWINRLKRT